MKRKTKPEDMTAQKFVDNLLTEGAKVDCDETNPSYNQYMELPPYYDDALFKRGQAFFMKYAFSLSICEVLGVISIYAVPSILNVLKSTSRNTGCLNAYKRQLNTALLVQTWIIGDFTPGSKMWETIGTVRKMHNVTSKNNKRRGINSINQKDMALTQLAFIGYPFTKPELFGLQNVDVEDFKSYQHFWRVVGYLLGMEDRFNLCGLPYESTVEACEKLISRVYRPCIEKKDEEFLEYVRYLCSSITPFFPELTYSNSLNYLHHVVQKKENEQNILDPNFIELNIIQKAYYKIVTFYLYYLLQYDFTRVVRTYVMGLLQLSAVKFPIIAMVKYGFTKGYFIPKMP